MSHVVLLGDSIFDNASYVPGGRCVTDHLRHQLPAAWRVTLLAVDGDRVPDVAQQLRRMPRDATHLVVSAGGNDALGYSGELMHERPSTFADVLMRLGEIREEFHAAYRRMLAGVLALGKPAAVCTIYDSVPGLSPAEQAGLCIFNDIITREAFRHHLGLIDLRVICGEADDYSSVSPIEPSEAGGEKIARAIGVAIRGGGKGTEGESRVVGALG